MNLRGFLRSMGLRHTLCFEAAELAYFITFFVARNICYVVVYYYNVGCPKMSIIPKIAGVCIFAQIFVYEYRFYEILKRRSAERKERKEKNINMGWLTPPPKEELERSELIQQSAKVTEAVH